MNRYGLGSNLAHPNLIEWMGFKMGEPLLPPNLGRLRKDQWLSHVLLPMGQPETAASNLVAATLTGAHCSPILAPSSHTDWYYVKQRHK